ncbi:hypothetical protein AN958_06557 [Leucoagaricus sp. SymC.cos]|nr:hypothetical protein AN958_06557 [Leucoagaricus sp. SymC.cos]
MAWAARSQRFLAGLATIGALGCSSAFWNSKIYADNEAPASNNESQQKKWDPLVNHNWMACGIGGWHSTKVSRYDYASLPNRADRYTSLAFSAVRMNHGPNWVYTAISDGIRGWEASVFVYKSLIPTLRSILESLMAKHTTQLGDPDEIHPSAKLEKEVPSGELDQGLKRAFSNVEHGIINSSTSEAPNAYPLASAITGATATVAFYDDETKILKIAHVGDARAVLGRRVEGEDGSHHLEVEVLTSDHTSVNLSEQARLGNTHTAEEVSIIRKYIGRDVTRAFGLAMCKWGQDVQERMHREYMGEPPLRGIPSTTMTITTNSSDENTLQSYLTAEPEITTVKMGPDDFLILGSYGLWKSLTSEEAVGLVETWLSRKCFNLNGPIMEPTEEHFVERDTLPVRLPDESEDDTTWYKRWNLPKRFICVDENAGVHLVRNALGGAHRAFTEGLVMVPHPFCANNR